MIVRVITDGTISLFPKDVENAILCEFKGRDSSPPSPSCLPLAILDVLSWCSLAACLGYELSSAYIANAICATRMQLGHWFFQPLQRSFLLQSFLLLF